MEVVVKVLLVNLDEVLFTLNTVLGCFPDDVLEADGIVFYGWCTKQAVAELVIEDTCGVRSFTHDHVFVIAGDKAVRTRQRHVADADKAQGSPPLGIEGIELCQCTVVDDCHTAIECQAIAQRIGQLTIGKMDIAMNCAHAVTLGVMYHAMLHRQPLCRRVDGS